MTQASASPLRKALGRVGEHMGIAIWLLPAYFAMFAITAYPLAANIVRSFRGDAPLGQPKPFVGLENYREVIQNPAFAGAVFRTLIWTVGVVTAAFIVGLALALLLNRPGFWVKVFRGVLLIPWLTPSIVSALIWRYMYFTDYGVINGFLRSVGLGFLAQGWITDPNWSLVSAMVVHTWRSFGFYMIMMLGALQAVPGEILEAAKVDGASGWRLLTSIILPQIRPVVIMVILLDIIWVTNNFDTIFIVTGGGPMRSSETLPLFVYYAAFQRLHFPQAAAGAVLMFFIAAVMIGLYLLSISRGRQGEGEL